VSSLSMLALDLDLNIWALHRDLENFPKCHVHQLCHHKLIHAHHNSRYYECN
jgi:hypothetical protein